MTEDLPQSSGIVSHPLEWRDLKPLWFHRCKVSCFVTGYPTTYYSSEPFRRLRTGPHKFMTNRVRTLSGLVSTSFFVVFKGTKERNERMTKTLGTWDERLKSPVSHDERRTRDQGNEGSLGSLSPHKFPSSGKVSPKVDHKRRKFQPLGRPKMKGTCK